MKSDNNIPKDFEEKRQRKEEIARKFRDVVYSLQRETRVAEQYNFGNSGR